ncbi:MAG TPA: hypothetical protein V6D06_06825 [Trichocoleus sp.]
MKRASWLWAVSLSLLGWVPSPLLAQSCAYSGAIAPAPTTRTYRNSELGFAFDIPANYRAMGLANGRVAFYDPATFEYVQCAVRNGQTVRVAPAATLYVNYTPLPESNLVALTQRVRPWLVLYQPTYEPIADSAPEAAAPGPIPVLRYQYVHEIYGNTVVARSFRSPNGQWLVTVEGAANSPVLPLVLPLPLSSLQP